MGPTVLCTLVWSLLHRLGGAEGIDADGKRGRKGVTLMELELEMLM